MKFNNLKLLLCMILACIHTDTLMAGTVTLDDFSDGILDPAWNLTSQNSSGWSYAETSSQLQIYAVQDNTVNDGNWGYQNLQYTFGDNQSFSSLTDFALSYYFSYDAYAGQPYNVGANYAMQSIEFRLFDSSGNTVVSSQYRDAWNSTSGERVFKIGSSTTATGAGTMPYSQAYNVDITRDASGFTKISWANDTYSTSGYTSAGITGLEIILGHYRSNGSGSFDYSYFGDSAIDSIILSGSQVSAVPVPATIWLFGSGLLGLIGVSRQKKTV